MESSNIGLESLSFTHLDDNSFKLCLLELASGSIHYNFDRFENLHFNPLSDRTLFSSQLNNLDIVLQSSTQTTPCEYFLEDELPSDKNIFNKQLSPDKDLAIFHLNARSLHNCFDNFCNTLHNIKFNIHAIGITETWLTDNTVDLVNIPGYNFISNHRISKRGGGVGLYLQDLLEYKILKNLNYSISDVIETLFVEISIPQGKNMLIGVIYQ